MIRRMHVVKGAEVEEALRKKGSTRILRNRIVPSHCGICGKEVWLDPFKQMAPTLCWECRAKHEKSLARRGLGAGWCRALCVGCGREVIVRTSVRSRPKCDKCREKAAKEKAKLNRKPVDTELRRKRLVDAYNTLAKQYGIKAYEMPLGVIAKHINKPGWWDSVPEIVATAEYLRLGYEVKPQKKIGKHSADLFLTEKNLVVEVDGEFYHGREESERRDHENDVEAIALGLSVVRISAEEVMRDVRATVKASWPKVVSAATLGCMKAVEAYMGDKPTETKNRARKFIWDKLFMHRERERNKRPKSR